MTYQCKRCHREFDTQDGNFYLDRKRDTYQGHCKKCRAEAVTRCRRRKKAKEPKVSTEVHSYLTKLRRNLAARDKRAGLSGTLTVKELASIYLKQQGKCCLTKYDMDLNIKYFKPAALRHNEKKPFTADNTFLCWDLMAKCPRPGLTLALEVAGIPDIISDKPQPNKE